MPSPGDILDGYRLTRAIGRGGFGEVWLCQLEATREWKALKFLSSADLSQLEQELKALIHYRTIIADLNCPNLVTVEHVNQTGDGLFYVMPLADGPQGLNTQDAAWQPLTLAAQIAQRRTAATWFSAAEIRAVMLPLLEAVRQLTAAGVVHRDIKPDNILFLRGRPCLGDVGLLTEDAAQITRRGTPGYAAPSWYLETGGNPDMWGLATTLYTLISGNNPDKVGRGAFLYPPQGKASVERPAWDQFHHAIFRATNADAAERFLRFNDFAKALDNSETGSPGAATSKTSKVLRRLTAIVLCLLALLGGVEAFRQHLHESTRPQATQSVVTATLAIIPGVTLSGSTLVIKASMVVITDSDTPGHPDKASPLPQHQAPRDKVDAVDVALAQLQQKRSALLKERESLHKQFNDSYHAWMNPPDPKSMADRKVAYEKFAQAKTRYDTNGWQENEVLKLWQKIKYRTPGDTAEVEELVKAIPQRMVEIMQHGEKD